MRISLEQAVDLLRQGQLVAVPTETVYGLAASIDHPEAIDHIYALKKRPANNPLIIHVASPEQMHPLLKERPDSLLPLIQSFWPGPLTLVLPIYPERIPANARAHLMTAAFRIPDHPLALQLLSHISPLVMPSANLSGKPSATRPEHVEEDFGESFPVLDGGPCTKGVESTILFYQQEGWQIVRLGALAPEKFESVLGYRPRIAENKSEAQPICPGHLYRHYAPKAQLILTKAFDPNLEGCILGYSDRHYPSQCPVLALGPSDVPEIVAAHLFSILRRVDEEGYPRAHVDIDIPNEGLWRTILERLHKAASAYTKGKD
jgi:L-threonylcarbamoyladenylate synthase